MCPLDPLQGTTAHLALPGFWLEVSADAHAVWEIRFLTSPPPVSRGICAVGSVLSEAMDQLSAWRKDGRVTLNFPYRLEGTSFRQRVWAQIAAIPQGQTRTYGEIARILRSAPRAVGQACGDNPLPILIPCHRVVSQRGLGGFNHSAGSELLRIKQWLLAHES